MRHTTIPGTGLSVSQLCLGGNVFGWTADEAESFAVLDAFAEAGGTFIDTADVYSVWVPGHQGGESERIIGRWLAARGNRDGMIVATKVGMKADRKGLAPATIQAAADESLARLGTETIDLYYAHADDPETPLADTLAAFDGLVRAGKVRYVAASNYAAPRLAEALEVSASEGLARYVALQPHYNLAHRTDYEGALQELCQREHLACFPYFALAKGFLTGKYRPGRAVDSKRAKGALEHLDDRGVRLLDVLDGVAAAHGATVAAVSLAWLQAQPTVGAPIASARTPEQLGELLPMADLVLSEDELAALDVRS